MSQENKPRAGMQLGHYKLTVKLGEGIFSETWLSEHAYLEGKEICLKIFNNEKFVRILQNQKFLRILKDYAHLPYIEDYDPNAPFPYLAEEVLTGKSLRQFFKEGKKLDLELFKKIVAAVKCLHDQNLVHLDLRPEHLMIDANGNIKFLDYIFGQITTMTLAEYYREFAGKAIPIPKPIMRSLLYKSKQHRMGLDLSMQADIYSLGIILFEMATGTYPTKKAEFPSNVVPDLPKKIDMIYSCCCNKGEDFFSHCNDMLQALEEEERKEVPKSFAPGINLIKENAAIVSVHKMAGEKNYVDGKNIGILSKNLDELISSNLQFFAFDFQGIDYVNSSAIGYIVNFCDRSQSVVMFSVDKKVMTILSALGLEKVISIVNHEKEAKEYLLKKMQEKRSS
ncbi:MAG: protein kinase [Candidatus Brocadiae bacterium]|nr:protein kinase [Candidatus Brocadiia bacterium]